MGISAVEHATKLGGIDVTLETEVLGDGTHPSTCRFATPRVVVLSRGGYLAHVVLATSGGELSDVQHDRIPSTTWLCAGAQARCGIGLGMSEPWSGQYELVGEPISTEGAGSLVQRARRLSDGEEFVLKAATGEYQRLRFEREIEVGLRLDHPHVMPIIDSDAAGLWFTMPIASGHALTPNAAIAPEVLLGHLEDIASGVEAGHAVGFIHRDLKPDNLLIVDGRLVVADWGIAQRSWVDRNWLPHRHRPRLWLVGLGCPRALRNCARRRSSGRRVLNRPDHRLGPHGCIAESRDPASARRDDVGSGRRALHQT